MTTVEALKSLYEHLGGDAADVADLTLNPELVAALSELEIGGGGSATTVYTDTSGAHGGDGYDTTPYPLYKDAGLTTAMTQAEIAELIKKGGYLIADPANTQWQERYMSPVTAFISPAGASNSVAVIGTYMLGEGLQAIYVGIYTE